MEIEWSEKAKNDYWANIDFLQNKWTENEVYNFIEKVIDILRKANITFKSTGYKSIFQITITKQITLYYRIKIDDKTIELLRFFNTYQNPDKLSF